MPFAKFVLRNFAEHASLLALYRASSGIRSAFRNYAELLAAPFLRALRRLSRGFIFTRYIDHIRRICIHANLFIFRALAHPSYFAAAHSPTHRPSLGSLCPSGLRASRFTRVISPYTHTRALDASFSVKEATSAPNADYIFRIIGVAPTCIRVSAHPNNKNFYKNSR